MNGFGNVPIAPPGTKPLFLSKQEAGWVSDMFRVSDPRTKDLALKLSGLVLEFEADDAVRSAEHLVAKGQHIMRTQMLLARGSEEGRG